MINLVSCEVTAHAETRADERLKWSPETLKKMADRALNFGAKPADYSGKLRRYLDRECMVYHSKIRIYGEHVYCFKGDDTLVTVFRIPNKLKSRL